MWRVPLSDLNYDHREEEAVAEVLRSRWLTMGRRTEQFEHEFAAFVGARHAVAVANCTCALELAYAAAAKRCAGAVLTAMVPDITFVATANAAVARGFEVSLADIESPEQPFVDAEAIDKNTPVVTVVHYAGFSCEDTVAKAKFDGAFVIEDAAHAAGGYAANGQHLGTLGEVGCFSFFSNKNLATGEGGMIVTDDDEMAQEFRLARSHGMTSPTFERHQSRGHGYDIVTHGHNYRCTEITAALGLVQLAKLREGNERRRHLYRLYVSALAEVGGVKIVFGDHNQRIATSACHIMPVLFDTSERRNAARAALDEAGIQTSHHYPPLHTFAAFRASVDAARLPHADSFAARELTLPLHPRLQEIEVEEVCSVIARAMSAFFPDTATT